MISFLEHLTIFLHNYTYVALLPAAIIEGPIVTILAGVFVAHGYLKGTAAYIILVVGDLVGDSLYYFLGRWGKQFIDRWGIYLGVTDERLQRVRHYMTSHSGKTLLLGKLAHGIGGVILVAAGVAKVPFLPFLLFNLLGTIPKTLGLFLLGFYFSQAYLHFNRYLNYTAWGFVVISIISVLTYLLLKRLVKKISPV